MATQASEQLAVRVCDGTISAARKRTSSVHYRTVARAVERKDMAPHQTFYLKADRSLLNPHESADWNIVGKRKSSGRSGTSGSRLIPEILA